MEGEPAPAPFARGRLDNGARVLVRENRAMPLVAVDCWLSVGTLGEPAEIVGVSHFLEHMFFKGTPRYPVGAMDRLVKGMGGYNNAATSMEYTHYYIVAPAEHVSTAIDLLADHLSEPSLPAAELERERQVVKEEIRQKEDSPAGRLYSSLSTAVFGDTPYAREILGEPETLDAIDEAVMRSWWESRYVAERLVVAIAGDIDAARAIEAVEDRLGGLRAGASAGPPPPPPPSSPGTIDATMEVGQAYLAWAFPTAGRDDLDEAVALEIGAAILGAGMTSRLHRRLVDELRLVTAVDAWTFGLERVGVLGVNAVCAPERRERVESEVADVIEAAARHGVSREEVGRARAMLLAGFAYDNETNADLTGTLGEFEVLFGDAGAYRAVLERIEATTPDAVNDALARRLDPRRAARAAVTP